MHSPQESTGPMEPNRPQVLGPFDIVGDIHGCADELDQLLELLGYTANGADSNAISHPDGRRMLFLGDLVDRGPQIPRVVRRVMRMVRDGSAWCIRGNHEAQMLRHFDDASAPVAWGLEDTLEQLNREAPELRQQLDRFARQLPFHLVLDQGNLVIAHAGLPEQYHGKFDDTTNWFALYGSTPQDRDAWGHPRRLRWAQDYRGRAQVVYGHTPRDDPQWENRTLCVDTGCVYGGKLTALRYPEGEQVSVPALQSHH